MDISRIEFDQCDEFPCIVHHGTTATGRAHMVANAATDSLTCKVIKILLNFFATKGAQWVKIWDLCVSVFELWKEILNEQNHFLGLPFDLISNSRHSVLNIKV